MKRWKTGLSLNELGWGLVQLRRVGDEERFERVQRGEWRSDEAGARGTELKRIFLEHGVSSSVMVSVTVNATLLRTLDLPLVPEKDIAAVIRGSWEELRGFTEPLLAYEVLNRSDRLQVRVGAVERSELMAWMELLEIAGLEPSGIILQAQAVCGALFSTADPTLFLIMSHCLVETGIAIQGAPVFLRTIPWDKGNPEEIQQELSFTRHAWARQGGTPPQKILTIPEDLFSKEQVGIDAITTQNAPGCLEGNLLLMAAYGAVLQGNNGLFWCPVIPAAEKRKKRRTVMLAAACVALFTVGSLAFHRAHVKTMEAQTAWVQNNLPLYRELESLEAQDERMIAEISRRRRLWNERRFYSDTLARWQRVAPTETVLTQWIMEGSKVVEIAGRTPSISRLIEALGKDPLFKNLSLKGAVYHNPKGWDEFRLGGFLNEEVSR